MGMYAKDISKEKRASLEFAEAARETEWKHPSFALQLFHGEPKWSLISPFPRQSANDKKIGDKYLNKLKAFLKENLNPEEVDKTSTIPDNVMKGLGELGAFAMKVPEAYGGLGLSQVNYNRAIHLVSSYCASTAVLLSAHQSIGVPQPLISFGTPAQKKKYLPLFKKGVVSAFALTEAEAGSDPRNMTTTAIPTEDGQHYLINGEKLWCTNGVIAGVMVVMAVTPPKIIKGKERKQITAFIVETETPGFEVLHRCHFMGLHGIQNGLLKFTNVKVPKENIIGGEGNGLKLALTTLNTGRLTIPGASVGVSKWCLHVVRQWAGKRNQWGSNIGAHESVALKIGYIASHTYAMDALTWLTSAMADDKNRDIRLEAAMSKHFSTLHAWKIVDDTLQIRAGQGYETSESLRARGMDYWPVERVLRDVRINLIIEGTTEIMRLFIAREALDPHLSKMKPLLSGKTSAGAKAAAFFKMAGSYALWYPKLWFSLAGAPEAVSHVLPQHSAYIQRASRRLARITFHQMVKHQQKLEAKQSVLNRLVDIGTELFAMSAVCSYTASLVKNDKDKGNATQLADTYCTLAQERINQLFGQNGKNCDRQQLKTSKLVLDGKFEWLENDIIV